MKSLQVYLRSLREAPAPELVRFVLQLNPGAYGVTELWREYNRCRGFQGSSPIFRYALLHAGMIEQPSGRKLLRPDTLDSSDGQVRPETPGGHP